MEERENLTDRNVAEITREQSESDQQKERTEELEPLFEKEEAENFRSRWMEIQTKFVDNPQESVREADELVANALKSVTAGFHNRRTSLEKQWNHGDNVSTEDLRMALKRYRSFFDRLLSLGS
jgi:hypothetical protein